MKKESKYLRIAGFLEILLGVVYILSLRGLFGADSSFIGVTEGQAVDILFGAAGLYGAYIFQIVAGLFGVLLANKKSLITVLFGVVLFLAQLVPFLHLNGSLVQIVIHVLFLIVPYFYLHNAYKVFRRA